MARTQLYPLKLRPALHVKVWGGRRLSSLLGKPLPSDEPYGESWELHDSAVVVNGPLAGKTLGSLLYNYSGDLTGYQSDPADGFPLLAKFIDAERWLSVQVHPNDAQARELEGEPRGKTEAWIILHAEEGAQLVNGIKPGTSRAAVAEAIANDRLDELLVFRNVTAGDVLYMPANTIHALGPGILVYEIQQSSDSTYRLYDWGRLGLDGLPRTLHIEKGLRVADLNLLPDVERPKTDQLVDGDYFSTFRHRLRKERITMKTDGRFQALTCSKGHVRVEAAGYDAIDLASGETGLIPACVRSFSIDGEGTVLRSFSRFSISN